MNALNRLTRVDYPSGRHVEYGYDGVGNRLAMLDSADRQTRWAASARASGGSAASGAVGPPDAQTWAGPTTQAWLEVTFATAERANGIRIRESWGAPLVMRVDLIDEAGTSHTVYTGGDATANGGWLVVPLPLTDYRVQRARVVTAPAPATYPNSPTAPVIDAVGLDVPGTQMYAYNGFNQLLSVTGTDGASTTFAYDGNGNQTTKAERGASGTVATTTYAYDADNRLVGLQLPTGLANAFEYDANGLRTRKTDSGGTTRYLLDGLSVVAQYDTAGARQAWYTQSLARIDEVLSVVNEAGKHWYQADALGSVYGLTDQAGVLVASQDYDVFGAPAGAGEAREQGQPFGFTGREHDQGGLVYSRARYLNPGLGTWTQPDPYTESLTRNGGLGAEPMVRLLGTGVPFPSPQAPRYAYADGRPSVFTDPTGLMVVYVGVGASAVTFMGGATFGVGMAIGTGTGFSYVPVAFTAGFAIQAYQLINVGASVDFSVFWGLEPDEACSIRGPFLTVSMDPGLGFSVSMVWSISWPSLQSFIKTGRMPDLSAALGAPVGLTISPGILPTKWGLPAGGVTIFGTWSWVPYSIGCSCQ